MLAPAEHVLPCKANVLVSLSWIIVSIDLQRRELKYAVLAASLRFRLLHVISCKHGIDTHLQFSVDSFPSIYPMRKLDFPRATQHSYFTAPLPRQHVLSLCPASWPRRVLHGTVILCLWRALAVSAPTVWTQDRTLWKQSVRAGAVSQLSHMASKPFYSSCGEKNPPKTNWIWH